MQVHVQCVVQRKHHPRTEAGDGDDEGQATSQAKSTSGMRYFKIYKFVRTFGCSAILIENLTAVGKANCPSLFHLHIPLEKLLMV